MYSNTSIVCMEKEYEHESEFNYTVVYYILTLPHSSPAARASTFSDTCTPLWFIYQQDKVRRTAHLSHFRFFAGLPVLIQVKYRLSCCQCTQLWSCISLKSHPCYGRQRLPQKELCSLLSTAPSRAYSAPVPFAAGTSFLQDIPHTLPFGQHKESSWAARAGSSRLALGCIFFLYQQNSVSSTYWASPGCEKGRCCCSKVGAGLFILTWSSKSWKQHVCKSMLSWGKHETSLYCFKSH